MSKELTTRGDTSRIERVFLPDSSSTTGAGLTGLTFSSSGLIISTIADNEATAITYTAAGSTIETITTLGTYAAPTATKCRFREVDATNHPGLYEIQLADARYAIASSEKLVITISGATNLAPTFAEIQLAAFDVYDGVRGALTALPNAAAEAAGGIYTRGTGAGQINQPANGSVDANAVSAVAAFFQDFFTVDSGEVSGAEISGSAVLEIAKVVWDRILSGATHNISTSAGRRLRGLQEFQGYDNGQVWIDTVNGTAGTIDFENGTVENSVNSIADAKTIAASVGLSDFHIINGSTITFAASTINESYFGDNWVLALGSQAIAGAYIQGAVVSGISTATSECHFEGCDFNNASIQIGHFDFCSFSGTLTQTLAGDYNYHNCYSKGDIAPIFAKTAGQVVVVEFHNWSGDITINGVQAGDTIELGGNFRTIILNGTGGTVHVHGHYEVITSGGFSGALSITGATKFEDVASVLVDTNELQTDDVPGLIAALNNLDQAGVIAALEDAGLVLYTGTISALSSQTSFTLAVGASEDPDAYERSYVVIEDVATSEQKTLGLIQNYAAGRVVTLNNTPDFTIAVGDKVAVLPVTPAMPNRLAGTPTGMPLVNVNIPDTAFFSGITSLAEWLGLIAGKQTGDATARTEVRATGVGSGTYDETANSLEANRDRGDAAWITATGFSTHDAAAVWSSATRTLTAATNITDDGSAIIMSSAGVIGTVNLVNTTTVVTNGVTLAAAEDVYHADIDLSKDDANTKDEYSITWYKNGVRVTTGITVPTIQIKKRVDGTDLVASTAMTQIGSTGSYKYDEATNRITAGEAVLAIVNATIDSGARSFARVISRDSSV